MWDGCGRAFFTCPGPAGEKDGSRKLTYGLRAKGTQYAVGAGIYDDKATIAELSKLTSAR